MKAADWIYIGEGGKHAIFSWNPNANHSNEVLGRTNFRGRILRLEKSVIARSAQTVPPLLTGRGEKHVKSGSIKPNHSSDNDKFISMMCEIFQQYADRPQRLDVDWQFLQELRHQTLASGQIPSRRLKDWTMEVDDEQSAEPDPVGFLHWDYRVSLSATSLAPSKQSYTVSLEIKPKAGYRAVSPFVSPTRRAKFKSTRFALMQSCYRVGKLSRGWMPDSRTANHSSSSYDPLDFFSLDTARIKRALAALLAKPQNNLTVRVNEMVIVNENIQRSNSVEWGLVRDALALHSNDDCRDHLLDMSASVLSAEDFLSKVLSLQCLDILDADGAICVYHRLVDLCGGSRDAAEELVDTLQHISTSSCKQPHNLLKESPLKPPKDWEGISRLCMEVERFADILNKDRSSLPSESILDGFRKRSLDIVSTLSIDECCYLLQTWLISLTVCDLSFYLAFHVFVAPTYDPNSKSLDDRSGAYSAQTHQSENTPGCLICSHRRQYALHYQLKVIDFDQKPARKLRSRLEKEAVLDDCGIT